MQQAFNPQTGEVLFLVNNEWVPPAQVAQNAEGQKAYLVGNEWIMGAAVTPKTEEPKVEAPATEQAPPVAEQAQPVVEQAPPVAEQAQPVAEQATPQTFQESPPYEPVQAEMTAWTPSLLDKIGQALGLGGNRDRASVELAARRIAQQQGIPVSEVYKQAGGERSLFNPEGRPTLQAAGEAATVVADQIPRILPAAAHTIATAIRGGDISTEGTSFLDKVIDYTEAPKTKIDKNYESFAGIGESLGFTVATAVSAAAAATLGTATMGPAGGVAAAFGTSGTVAFRASKDDFLSRVKEKLDNDSKQIFGRPLNEDEWTKAKDDYNSLANKYGAWEAIPEAASTLVFLKAFSTPLKGASGAKLANIKNAAASYATENITETTTAMGQNPLEKEAGLTQEDLSIRDAFRQQFIQTLFVTGAMSGGAKAKQVAQDFYVKNVEPTIAPDTALGRAIQADIEQAVFNPESIRQEAINALSATPSAPTTMAQLAPQAPTQIAPPPPPPEVPVQAATGETIPIQPLDTAQKQQQAVATGRIEPTIGAGVTPEIANQQAIEARVEQLVSTVGLSKEDALDVAKEELGRGELSVRRPEDIGVVPGANEPSVPLSSERGSAAQGVAAPSAEGLADAVGGAGKPDVGAGSKRGALTTAELREKIKGVENTQNLLRTEGKPPKEGTRRAKRFAKLEEQRQELIRQWADADAAEQAAGKPPTTLSAAPAAAPVTEAVTPPAPPTFGKLEKKQKTEVINQAKALWQSREINLPIEQAWDNLPKWKRDAFAQQMFDAGDAFTQPNAEGVTASIEAMNAIAALPAKQTKRAAAPEFVGPKRPAGRPRKQRTEANQAIYEANRAADQADLKKAARGVDKSIKVATKQPATKGTAEQQKAALAQAASDRYTALYNLFLATKNKYYRDVRESGLKAKAFLESDAVTPKERMELQQRFEFEQQQRAQGTQRSAMDIPVDTPYLASALAQEVRDFIQGVDNPRVLQVVQSWSDLPSRVRFQAEKDGGTPTDKGFVQDGVAYLIADNIQEGTGRAVFMHEVGVHLGLQGLLPSRLLNNLVGQIRTWAQRNDGSLESQIAQQALDRVERAGTSPAQQNSEAIAYFIEGAMNAGVTPQSVKANTEFGKFIQQIYQLFRAAVRKLGLAPNSLTTQDIVDMAFGAARLEMVSRWHGTAATFRTFNHDFLSSGEGMGRLMAGQAFGGGSYFAERNGIAYGYFAKDVKNKIEAAIKKFKNKYQDFYFPNDVIDPATQKPVVKAFDPVTERALTKLRRLGVDTFSLFNPSTYKKTKQIETFSMSDFVVPGSMMRVDFKIAPDEWLQWDKPVSEQSPLVQEKLEKARQDGFFGEAGLENSDVFQTLTGEQIVEAIQERAKSALYQVNIFNKIPAAAQAVKQDNYKLTASMYLDSLGIKGTQFRDASSRTDYNFLIRTNGGYTTIEHLIEVGALDYTSASTLVFYDGDMISAQESTQRDMDRAQEAGDDGAYQDAQVALDQLNGLAEVYAGVEDASVKTHNFVVFDDKNIIRVASQRGAKQEQTQFSKNFNTFDEVTTDEVDPSFNRFTTPTQALNYVQRAGTQFERVLAGKLKPFVKDVQYIVVNKYSDIPRVQVLGEGGVMMPLAEAFKETSGMYAESYDANTDVNNKFILLRGENFVDPSLQGLGSNMFLHEALHAATIDKLSTFERLQREGLPIPADLKRLVAELSVIMIRAQDKYSEMKAEALIGGPPVPAKLALLFEDVKVGTDMHEFVSYGMTDSDMQQFLLGVEGKISKAESTTGYYKSLFTRFTNALREAFGLDDMHTSAMQDLILVTGVILEGQKTVKAAAMTPAMAARKKRAISLAEHKLTRSKSSSTERLNAIGGLGKLSKNADKLLSTFDRRLDKIHPKALQFLLKFIPTPVLNAWLKNRLPSLIEVNTLVERMGGMRSKLIAAAKVISDDIATFVKSDKQAIVVLADALHLSRLNNFSPLTYSGVADALINDQKLTDARTNLNQKIAQNALQGTPESARAVADAKRAVTVRENQIKDVYAKWDALASFENGQNIYKRMLTYYKDTFAVYRQMLDMRIARLQIPGKANDPNTPKGKLMAEINKLYMLEMPEAYAPFMRRGDYRLDFDGERGRETYMFATSSQRDDFIAAEAQKRNISRSEFFDSNKVKISDKNALSETENELRDKSELLKGIFGVIDEQTQNAPLTKLDIDELKDSVYQFWLKSGPEDSIRKQFLHARNVTGFSSDVYQNFVDYSTRAAVAISRLRYQDEILAKIEQAKDSLEGNPVMNKLQKFVDEISNRAKEELFPPEQSGMRDASRKFKQYTFMYAMTSMATAAVQMLSLISTVLPFIMGEYGVKGAGNLAKYMGLMVGNTGWAVGKSSVSLVEYIGDRLNIKKNGDIVFEAPTLAESDYIKNDPFRLKAYQEFVARGAIDNTFISNITDMNKVIAKESDNILVRGLNMGATAMTASFNTLERLSRQVTLMSVFESEYAKSGNFDGAVAAAITKTNAYTGNASSYNTPSAFKGPIASILWQFKQFPIGMFTLLVGMGHKLLSASSDIKERAVAAKMLATFYLATFMFAGVQGLPGYDLATSAVDLTLNKLIPIVDDSGRMERVIKNPGKAYNSDRRFREDWLPEYFGDTMIKGLDGRYHPLSEIMEIGPVSALTGWNLSGRMSMNGLLWRSSRTGDTWSEQALSFAKENVAPGAGVGLTFIDGAEQVIEGDIVRGLEKMTPAPIKSLLASYRLSSEGEVSGKGDVVIPKEELGRFAIAGQALGFQPTEIARVKQQSRKSYEEDKEVKDSQKRAYKKLDNAVLNPEAGENAVTNALNVIRQHNLRYASYPKELRIDTDTMLKHIDGLVASDQITNIRGQRIKNTMLGFKGRERLQAVPQPRGESGPLIKRGE